MAGERFGPYLIEDLLGRGSMGEVHRATDLRKGRVVALKRLAVAHSHDEGFVARFRREAEMTARLNEPHVIPIHDYGEIDGQLYLDMRLVEGVDLGTALARTGPLDPARAVAVVEQVAAALDAAHRAELVHRDVKPSNILLARPEWVERGAEGPDFAYLIDFGIAASLNDSRLTAHSTLIGTAAYMAPERFRRGAPGDHRVDVYALGCVLHEALAGRAPFRTGSIHQLMHAHLHEAPPRLDALRAGLPSGLDEVVATAMDKQPDRRYQHAGELAVAARSAVSGSASWSAPPPAPPPVPEGTEPWTVPAGTTPSPAPAGTTPTSSPSVATTDEFQLPDVSPTAPAEAPRPPRRRRLLIGALLLVVLGLLVLGGTAYLRSPDAAAPSATRLPDGLVGAWTGTQSEPLSGRSFPIRIDLSPGAVGEKVGEMSFSVFDCRFDLYLAGAGGPVDLQARPVAGPCAEGLLRAEVEGPDRFSYETVAADQVVARGDLARS